MVEALTAERLELIMPTEPCEAMTARTATKGSRRRCSVVLPAAVALVVVVVGPEAVDAGTGDDGELAARDTPPARTEQQPDEVAALRRALGFRDYVIVYRDGHPASVIEKVIVHERRAGRAGGATVASPAGTSNMPRSADGTDASFVPGGSETLSPPVPTAMSSPLWQPHAGAPVDSADVLPPVAHADAVPRRAPRATAAAPAEAAPPAAEAGPTTMIPEHVRRHIFDRLGVLVDDMRRRTLGGP
jgi:hypothetical protein